MTPMIAVDELPSTVQIAGVPAILSPAGTMNMVSLGLKERSSQLYTVTYHGRAESTPSATSSSADEAPRPAEKAKAPAANVAKKGGLAGALGVDNWRRGVKGNEEPKREEEAGKGKGGKSKDSLEDSNSGGEESTVVPQAAKVADGVPSLAAKAGAGTKGTLGRKMYCTHWIRWGECDYTQQGCLYKHEMPDEDKLMEIGIATYPRWYRIAHPEKFGGMVTEVPEYHRRPGPAPTDQLWRGGPQKRGIAPQSYDEFRSNASTGNQGPTMNPPAFIVTTYPGYNQYNGGFVQPQPQFQQQWNNGAHPRVTSMDTPLVKKSAPKAGANKPNSGTAQSFSQSIAAQAQSPPKTKESSAYVAHTAQSNHQSSSPQARPVNIGTEATSHGLETNVAQGSRRAALFNGTAQQDSNIVNGDYSPAASAQPIQYQGHTAAGAADMTASSRAPSVVEDNYRPLMPSQASQQQSFGVDHAPQTSVPQPSHVNGTKGFPHKQRFVPKGELQYVCDPLESTNAVTGTIESLPPRSARVNGSAPFRKGKKFGQKPDKMDVGTLVDM